MSYKQKAPESRQIEQGFSAKLRNLVESRKRHGRDGIDLNMDKKGAQPFLIFTDTDMDDEVFDLGCKIHESNPKLDHKAWGHWMMDAEIHRDVCGVTVLHRSEFFCENAAKLLSGFLSDHFGASVRFKPSARIAQRVRQ